MRRLHIPNEAAPAVRVTEDEHEYLEGQGRSFERFELWLLRLMKDALNDPEATAQELAFLSDWSQEFHDKHYDPRDEFLENQRN